MSATLIPEAEIWCPTCKTFSGKVFRKEMRDGFFEYVTDPLNIGKYCNVCEGVLVRK